MSCQIPLENRMQGSAPRIGFVAAGFCQGSENGSRPLRSGPFETRYGPSGADDKLALLGIGGAAEDARELHAFRRLGGSRYKICAARLGKPGNRTGFLAL